MTHTIPVIKVQGTYEVINTASTSTSDSYRTSVLVLVELQLQSTSMLHIIPYILYPQNPNPSTLNGPCLCSQRHHGGFERGDCACRCRPGYRGGREPSAARQHSPPRLATPRRGLQRRKRLALDVPSQRIVVASVVELSLYSAFLWSFHWKP